MIFESVDVRNMLNNSFENRKMSNGPPIGGTPQVNKGFSADKRIV